MAEAFGRHHFRLGSIRDQDGPSAPRRLSGVKPKESARKPTLRLEGLLSAPDSGVPAPVHKPTEAAARTVAAYVRGVLSDLEVKAYESQVGTARLHRRSRPRARGRAARFQTGNSGLRVIPARTGTEQERTQGLFALAACVVGARGRRVVSYIH